MNSNREILTKNLVTLKNGQFSDLKGAWQKRMGWCFLGGLIPQYNGGREWRREKNIGCRQTVRQPDIIFNESYSSLECYCFRKKFLIWGRGC